MVEIQHDMEPELRFQQFSSLWKFAKLGDIATFSKGKGISKSEIEEDGILPCIRYGELYTTYGVLIDKVLSRTNTSADQLIISKGGEVIIPASGEAALDIATASLVLEKGVALGGDLNIIQSELNGVFLSYYLNSRRKLDIARLAQGNSVVHLYSSQLSTLTIFKPTPQEQQKIATFFSSVDVKLNNLRRKRELLEFYKRGLMQKLFSQETRFKQNDGSDFPDWEEKELRELADRMTVKNTDDTISLVLTNSAIQGVVNQLDYFDKDIANENNLEGYYVVQEGDYVYNPRISVHAPVGPLNKNKIGKGLMSPLYSIFRFKSDNNEFYEQYFKTRFWHRYMSSVANYGARHDRMNISTADFLSMPLPCPNPEEQRKIVDSLITMDKKIGALTQAVNKMETFKKGLLQKMFI
jgi:type I restriction enzyme S subunit